MLNDQEFRTTNWTTWMKVEKLFEDWVILIEFNNMIVQAKNIKEYFLVKNDMKLAKQTI